MKVVVDRLIPFLNGVLEPFAEVVYLDGEAINPEHMRDADALLVRTRTYGNETLLGNSKVQFIGTATIGKDHLDLDWCSSHGIQVVNAPGCNADAVRQYITAALLSVSVRHGLSLQDQVLGVVGVGEVGSRVAKIAKQLGMQVLLCDPPRAEREGRKGFDNLRTLQQNCDILTFHTPLEKTGKHPSWRIVNGAFLSKLKPNAWIFNSSRGPVVDNTALRIALRSNSIGGAVLDVWEDEPESIDQELLQIVEIATPHIAGYSMEGKANATSQVVRALAKHFGISALTDWSVPAEALGGKPKAPICIDASTGTDELWLHEAVFNNYDIRSDDENLRSDPTGFEALRSRYVFRREFPVDRVELRNATPQLLQKMRALGFQVKVL